jgi:hypothetical protein
METSPQPQPAHAQPASDTALHFLVEHDGVIYLAKAVAAYDSAAAGLTGEQISGAVDVRRMFEQTGADLRAARVEQIHAFNFSRTHPIDDSDGDPPPDR